MATRLFHISDVHFGVEDRGALAKVERAILDEEPDALVVTGDLTQRATHSQYKAAQDWFGQFDVPVWVDPGNHDMPYYSLWERFTAPYRRYNALRDAVGVPAFETEDLVLVPLKTTVRSQNRWPWSDGVVTPSALEKTLKAVASLEGSGRWIIATAHHPLHGPKPGGPSDTIGGNEALAALALAGMDAFMTGHIHTPFTEHLAAGPASVQVIGAGTVSTRLRHGAPPSYNVLTCAKGSKPSGAIGVETRVVGAPPLPA